MNFLGQQKNSYTLGNNFQNAKSILSRGSNVFKTISTKINDVNNHPLTKQIEKRVPELTPYINKANQVSMGLQKTSNSLEKAQKKLQEVEKKFKYE